jgi:biopolymer transport protein ExbB/TolQ
VLLLAAFIYALLMLGGFYGGYMQRLKFKQKIAHILSQIRDKADTINFAEVLTGKTKFLASLQLAEKMQWRPIHTDKILADFELAGEKELEASRTLMRVGPMLGLMGTLIPMGPALVGLASGDIAGMAINMQVAFSTTVIGVFSGIVGFVTQLVKKRWFVEDINNMQYIFDLHQPQDPDS